MSTPLCALLSLSVPAVLGALSAPQGAPPPAAEILAAMERALGTPEARARAANLVLRGTLEAPGMPAACTFEEVYAADGRVRWTHTMAGMGAMTQGTTGAWSWSTDPAMGITIREGTEQHGLLRTYGALRHAPWKELYARAENAGKVRVGERDCWKLVLHPESGQPDAWYVDCETSRPARLDLRLPDPAGGELEFSYLLSDYRAVDGVLYPHARVQKFAAFELRYAIAEVEHPRDLAPERLQPPPDVVRAHADPARRSRPAPAKPGEFEIARVEERPTLSIRATVDATKISQHLATVFPEIVQHLGQVGGEMAGQPYSRYHAMQDGTIDLEAGIPLRKPVEGRGRVKATVLPAGDVATTWHFGPYHELPRTYDALEGWMKERSLVSAGGFWEVYWTDPGLEPDPKKWRTQILWPIEPPKK